MNLGKERELFLRHSHFEFLMQYVDWDGKSWVFKESNSLQDTQNYYKDYLHFVDCWSYWLASASRDGYKLVPVDLIERCISHIGIASCHPANSLQDDKQMDADIDALEKAMIGVCDD